MKIIFYHWVICISILLLCIPAIHLSLSFRTHFRSSALPSKCFSIVADHNVLESERPVKFLLKEGHQIVILPHFCNEFYQLETTGASSLHSPDRPVKALHDRRGPADPARFIWIVERAPHRGSYLSASPIPPGFRASRHQKSSHQALPFRQIRSISRHQTRASSCPGGPDLLR